MHQLARIARIEDRITVLEGLVGTPTVLEISSDPAPSAATLQTTRITYACDVSGGAFTVTLPLPEPSSGTTVTIVDAFNGGGAQAGTNSITVDARVSGNINGAQTDEIAANFGTRSFQSRGSGNGWMIL